MDRNKIQSFWKQHGIFISLMLLGLIFRISFMYFQGLSNDELSAWKRTEFSEWNSFWYFGVKAGDMHPVFYQGLLWVWVRLFGDSEVALRSTSLLFYLVNSWMIYQVSIRFFSKKAGLSVIALYVGLTFTIIHTVFARPYNSGTFFILLTVWSILEINRKQKVLSGWNIALIFGFLGAMLSHYYAFLTVGIIGLTSLVYVSRSNLKIILVCGVISLLAFLPHWPITAFQLNQGGLGWLPPPKWHWLFEFGLLFFNGSWILLTIILAGSVFFQWKIKIPFSREEKFCVGIFGLTYLTGHLVSVFYTPVLRELVMLFTLPFLFLILFRGFQTVANFSFNLGIYILPILIGFWSISFGKLWEPRNFGVFREIGTLVNEDVSVIGIENCTFASNFNDVSYINYYYNHDVRESIHEWSKPEVVYQLASRAKHSQKEYFYYNWSNHFHIPMYYEVIRTYFPRVQKHVSYFNSAATLFTNQKGNQGGLIQQKIPLSNTQLLVKRVVEFETEFLDIFKVNAQELIALKKDENDYFLVEMDGNLAQQSETFLVVQLERDGNVFQTGSYPVLYVAYDQSKLNEGGKLHRFFNAFSLPKEALPTDVIHVYLWNPKKQKVTLKNPSFFFVGSTSN